MLRKNWGQILLLAWPGVGITFIIIAVCARFVFPYGWSWPQALLFGAMLSATDPVAVVAVLHEVRGGRSLGVGGGAGGRGGGSRVKSHSEQQSSRSWQLRSAIIVTPTGPTPTTSKPLIAQHASSRAAPTLKVGADEKLASVIDGESLVNDGSALVIFLVLQQIVQGASLGAGEVSGE